MHISMIGLDPIGGTPRLTFGYEYLAGGVNLIPVLIGLFAISEILNKVHLIDLDYQIIKNYLLKK